MRGVVAMMVLAVGAVGCGDARPQPPPASPRADAGTQFDSATAGRIAGRVHWSADLPVVPPLLEPISALAASPTAEKTPWPNPNAPAIDPTTRGVRGAVVYLRGVDPRRARPWDLPPVRVLLEGRQCHVRQGAEDGAIGFVRRGDTVTMVSADQVFHSLHAGGAAYFTLAFPDPGKVRARRLVERGVVELTSAAGYFWMCATLFVDDHPYYTSTDATGHFDLAGVPPGRYEAVCWLPDWREEHHERDPESLLITRLFFRPPWETVKHVEVKANGSATVDFTVAPP